MDKDTRADNSHTDARAVYRHGRTEPQSTTTDPMLTAPERSDPARRGPDQRATVAANRSWWDAEASDYYNQHGDFLGDTEFVWGPEGWTEDQLGLLQLSPGLRVLEIGGGGAQCARWIGQQGQSHVVSSDLSAGMLARARALNTATGVAVPLMQCDGATLPLADDSVDVVFTAYGVMPFVADAAQVLREVCRVLRPGGRFVFSTSHPVRWAFLDEPGEDGLVARLSYFDRTPYTERDHDGSLSYVEHHRTLGDWVRAIVGAGLALADLVEPSWPEWNGATWGGWSPLRGERLPGTAIFVAVKPDQSS